MKHINILYLKYVGLVESDGELRSFPGVQRGKKSRYMPSIDVSSLVSLTTSNSAFASTLHVFGNHVNSNRFSGTIPPGFCSPKCQIWKDCRVQYCGPRSARYLNGLFTLPRAAYCFSVFEIRTKVPDLRNVSVDDFHKEKYKKCVSPPLLEIPF